MKLSLTKDEMLKRLRLAAGLEPLRTDCTVEQADGIDVDTMLLDKARTAYVALLHDGQRTLLAENDIAAQTKVYAVDSMAGGSRIALPDPCCRVFGLRMRGWCREAVVEGETMFDTIVARQLNPYTAATAENPVAVYMPGPRPCIYCWPESDSVECLSAVCDEGDGVYKLDEAALGIIYSSISPV